MKVILTQTVDKVGQKGDVVNVRDGFARNFLIPQCKAILCTDEGLKRIEEAKRVQASHEEKWEQESKLLAKKINDMSLTIKVAVGEKDKLFGSVTSHDIEQQLKERGIDVDKKKIDLKEPIRALGIFDVPIKLTQQVTTHLKLWVVEKK